MAGSRTIKTLGALVTAMTLGAFILILMETEPIRPVVDPLAVTAQAPYEAAAKLVGDTRIPVKSLWRNIVIHSTAAETPDIRERCHFVIDRDGRLAATERWRMQFEGRHIHVPGGNWDSDSIGVVVEAASRRSGPQTVTSNKLIHVLQSMLSIPDARVYAHGDIGSSDPTCGVFQND